MSACARLTDSHASRCRQPPRPRARAGFHCFAEGQGRLFLGVNFRKPLLTGFNDRAYNHLWHRGASCPPVPTPCARDAATSDQPDQQPLDGALLWLPGFRDSAPDVRGTNDENGTVVSLDNNVAVPLLFAALSHRAQTAAYMDCLQGQGSLVPHPVCRYDRPLGTRLGPEDTPVPERPERFKGIWRRQETQAASQLPPPVVPGDEFLPSDEAGFDLDGGNVADVETEADAAAFPATPAPTGPAVVPAVPAPVAPVAPAVPAPVAPVAPAVPAPVVPAPVAPAVPAPTVAPATPAPAAPAAPTLPQIPVG